MKMPTKVTAATAAIPMVVTPEPDVRALAMAAADEPSAVDSSSCSSKVCSFKVATSTRAGLLEALAMSTASRRLSSLI